MECKLEFVSSATSHKMMSRDQSNAVDFDLSGLGMESDIIANRNKPLQSLKLIKIWIYRMK